MKNGLFVQEWQGMEGQFRQICREKFVDFFLSKVYNVDSYGYSH